MVDIATSPRSAEYGRSATMLRKFPSASVSQGRAPRARLQVFGSRTYHRSDSLVPLKRYNHEFWRGYVGTWHINPHTPGPAHKIIHGLRSFKWRDSSREVLDQVCVYDAEKPPAKQRDLDQLYQANTFYDHSNPQQDEQEVVVAADDATLHLLAVDADACAQAPFALPAVAWGPGTDPAKREQLPGNVLSHAGAPGAWGLELFLWDGEYRWSASVSYDRDTGDLVRVVAVQEAYTDIKPSTCNVLSLASAKVHEPRDCLEPDASEWLPAGCPGRVCGVSVDSSSGKMNSWSSSDPVSWSPPSTSSHPANCVIILPDAMYLFVPLSLSMMGDDKQGCRIEFGGAMHPGASHAPHTPPPSQYQNRLHKVALEEIEEKQAVARQLATAKPRFQRLIIDYDLRSGMVSDIVRHKFQ
ncbi:hypothetical protein V8C86DRAFT_2817351 [Haematococcus lacustris]